MNTQFKALSMVSLGLVLGLSACLSPGKVSSSSSSSASSSNAQANSLAINSASLNSGTSTPAIEALGLPSGFSLYENYQIRSRTVESLVVEKTYTMVNGAINVSTAYITETKDESFGAYPLNLIASYLHSYKYVAESATKLKKEAAYTTVSVGPFAGQTYLMPWGELEVVQNGASFDFVLTFDPYMNTETNGYPAIERWVSLKEKSVNKMSSSGATYVSYSTKKYLKSQLESASGLTELEIARKRQIIMHLVPVNPSTHVTSIVGNIRRDGNRYHNETLVSGRLWSEAGITTLLQHSLQPVGTLSFSWVLYNECEIPEVHADTDWTGNFGQCSRVMYSSSQPQAQAINVNSGGAFQQLANGDLIYNSNKQQALLQLIPHRHPMPDKNTEQEGYYNLKLGQRAFDLFQ